MTKSKAKHIAVALLLVGIGSLAAVSAFGHCEIPCGIYDDSMRIKMLREHCDTIEKSMKQVDELKAEPGKNANQLVRWVNNKEDHCDEVQHIVYQYFMSQRVKPVEKDDSKEYIAYVKQITLLHGMLVEAMKCKQTTDGEHVKALRKLVDSFEEAYFKK